MWYKGQYQAAEIFQLSYWEMNKEWEVLKPGILHSVPWGLKSYQRLKISGQKMWQMNCVMYLVFMDNCDLMEEAAERGLNGGIHSNMK